MQTKFTDVLCTAVCGMWHAPYLNLLMYYAPDSDLDPKMCYTPDLDP